MRPAKRSKTSLAESNVLKELWAPNLFRLLLKDESSAVDGENNEGSVDENRFSEIGFPVWSDYWFDRESDPNLTLDNSTSTRISRNRNKKLSTSTDFKDEMTSSWSDPHVLITPQIYGDVNENISRIGSFDQPFQVIVHPQVQLVCDLHSHLCESEIIGFLAGKYDSSTHELYIQACFPCNSLERVDDDGTTDVEMDPIAELSVREVILKYDLDVVGWYHSHPLFRPDPSTTDIRNQYQYQQLFRHQSHLSEPFVGLIISTFDPNLPNFESLHQWFHVVPFTNDQLEHGERSSSAPMISSAPTEIQSLRRRGRKKVAPHDHSGMCHDPLLQPMYLPMKIEITVATIKEMHVKDRLIDFTVPPERKRSLESNLLALTPQLLLDIDEIEYPADDDCVFLKNSESSSDISPKTLTLGSGDSNSRNVSPQSELGQITISHLSPAENGNSGDKSCTTDLEISAELPPTSQKIEAGKAELISSSTKSQEIPTVSVGRAGRITRSFALRLDAEESHPTNKAKKKNVKLASKGTVSSQTLIGDFSKRISGEQEDETLLSRPQSESAKNSGSTFETLHSPIPTPFRTSTRVRKASFKKSSDATRFLSKLGTTSANVCSNTHEIKSPSIGHSNRHFLSSLQVNELARTILCSSPILMRYSSLCILALGFYYSRSNRRTSLFKKYKTESKIGKIKCSLSVWMKYFKMNELEQEEYLEKVIEFIKICWNNNP